MPVGYRSGGVDFDDLFEAGDGPSVANMRSGGAPLRYAPLSAGTKRPDVGYRVAGSDVSNLWAAKGSVSYRLPFDGQDVNAFITGLSGETGTISSTASIEIRADGTYAGVARGRAAQPQIVYSGTWLPAGETASNYEVRFTLGTQTGDANPAVNGAPTFTAVTALRAAGITAQVNAAALQQRNGSVPVKVEIRRIGTTTVRTADIALGASAVGQV